jgi:CRP/FNR family cyclic AMP-dependent transcriptional regulator
MDVHKALRRSAFFRNLTDEQLATLAAIAHTEERQRGEYLFREGAPADRLYLIVSGRVELEIQIDAGGAIAVVEALSANDLVGWSAIVEPYLYTSSGRCVQPTVVVAIDGRRLRELMRADARLGLEVYQEIARIVARRLRDTRLRLTRWLHTTGTALAEEIARAKPHAHQDV